MPYLANTRHHKLFWKREIYARSLHRSFESFQFCRAPVLIKQLQYYVVNGIPLEWLKSYLSDRKKYIASQDVSENCLDIICGV